MTANKLYTSQIVEYAFTAQLCSHQLVFVFVAQQTCVTNGNAAKCISWLLFKCNLSTDVKNIGRYFSWALSWLLL